MDLVLLLIAIGFAIILLIVNIYILAIYCHPDDAGFGTSFFCKFLVVIGLTLSCGQVLMLPLDVSNSRGIGGGLDMNLFWEIVYISNLIMLVLLIPLALFYYETDESYIFRKRLCGAICYEFTALILFSLIFFISYGFFDKADIPVTVYTASTSLFQNSTEPISWTNYSSVVNNATVYSVSSGTLVISVSFAIYVMAFLSFGGWWFFILFGGIGLSALPLDLIRSYKYRPKYKDPKDLVAKNKELQEKTIALLEKGEEIERKNKEADATRGFLAKRKARGEANAEVNKFKAAVVALEMEVELFRLEKNYKEVNPVVFLLRCLLGLVCAITSILWCVHILIFMVMRQNGIPLNLFLNNVLLTLEAAGLQFVAVGIFTYFALYLLWATTKGAFKFGIRIPFFFAVHPMKVNETLMNSFLFNVWLILLCSISVTQFTETAFSQYTRLTSIDMLFGTQVKYLRFFRYFYENNIFPIALLSWTVLSTLCMCIWPVDKPKILQEIELKKKEIKAG